MDTSLHIAGAQKHRLETEIVRLSRELEKYRKRNIGHGRSMTDAAQQTKEEPPRMTTVATQTDFVDQNNTENKPIESENQAAPPQLPKVVMTDAAVQAAEQLDEHTLSEQLSDQNTKVSGLLEVSIQESREERLDWELDVCDIQKASVQGSSSQTEASKGKEIACPTTVAHNGQRSMTLGIWPPQPLASNISQENSIVRLQWENERLRKENQRLRNALEQHQNENSRPEGPESQNSNASSEEAQVSNTDNRAEIQDADVEMRGITVGQVSAAQLNIEALVVPAIPPETSEAGEILQFNLQRFLSSINRDRIASSDDAKRRRDSQRHERRRQREQWRIERDEEARQQQRERSQREEDARRHQQRRLRRERETQRTHKHHKQSLKTVTPTSRDFPDPDTAPHPFRFLIGSFRAPPCTTLTPVAVAVAKYLAMNNDDTVIMLISVFRHTQSR
ncbi:hypothetical protein FVEG_17439 [Fusarium verticillioides 7600]|uniref:Uncharacterized protein n=1 Tax=Gibberella moniliformis (strain M3125 / FGSC 7600) TaxID=334819 RepID=W7N5Q2_GIBM7|nr:hypothetical protein FVEG_17439 [Fusarium verticillioides 7600]EWG54979.1 hypothetical protein FVEG_17439 [Fusarium verticillioides 7600]